MSLHNKPAFNTPDIIAGLKKHGLEPVEPSQLSDGFRLGYIHGQPEEGRVYVIIRTIGKGPDAENEVAGLTTDLEEAKRWKAAQPKWMHGEPQRFSIEPHKLGAMR